MNHYSSMKMLKAACLLVPMIFSGCSIFGDFFFGMMNADFSPEYYEQAAKFQKAVHQSLGDPNSGSYIDRQDLRKVRTLDLNGQGITDLIPLSYRYPPPNLESINLDNNNLTTIGELAQFKKLKKVSLRGNPNLPMSQVLWLKNKLPKCVILHD